MKNFLRHWSQALFEAQPLSTAGFGRVSFVELFGGPLIKGDLVYSLAEDGQGRLWVGTLGGGLRRVEARGGVAQDTFY